MSALQLYFRLNQDFSFILYCFFSFFHVSFSVFLALGSCGVDQAGLELPVLVLTHVPPHPLFIDLMPIYLPEIIIFFTSVQKYLIAIVLVFKFSVCVCGLVNVDAGPMGATRVSGPLERVSHRWPCGCLIYVLGAESGTPSRIDIVPFAAVPSYSLLPKFYSVPGMLQEQATVLFIFSKSPPPRGNQTQIWLMSILSHDILSLSLCSFSLFYSALCQMTLLTSLLFLYKYDFMFDSVSLL